ncbi:MAG: 3-deoxy-manno-octulosonate cytidylyltransferase [Acidaminococcales bacterium]|jgi:3-deoxy-manno-octulosonate cytidylyltransferase (CMP-KDO synthetase)|nr:3-deoxy-manno-octulosonate cytidylyltransferase [Acidaminococcales bacterium]
MDKAKVVCIIPARYASTRLPGKPLADIAGKPMIQHVYERACRASLVDAVAVATDDARICGAVAAFGGRALLTSTAHLSGTDRLAEAAAHCKKASVIINVQGDEPLIEPELIDRLARTLLEEARLKMATAGAPLPEDEYNDPAAVKVVVDKDGYALYFSRSLIPYPRCPDGFAPFKHVGIYAYRKNFLLRFARLPQSPLERAEGLEQLRALENGCKIKVLTAKNPAFGVDTPEDLVKINALVLAGGARKTV